ncbi:MAG TPA: hypothetical protein VGM68_08295 [Rhizomicrobium sp.]
MLKRMSALLLTLGLTASAAQAQSLLDKAVAHAGGEAKLKAVHQLHWTGTATIFAKDKIEIGTSTTVHPFKDARSDTWLATDGPTKTRSLIVEGDHGWTEMDGDRKPLPAAQARHEAAQYSLYGLMLLSPLRDPKAMITIDAIKGEVAVTYPAAPPTVLVFAKDGSLKAARNMVPAPDGKGPPIHQVIRFDGDMVSRGVHWPRHIVISQDGKLYYDLKLEQFEVS